MSSTLRPLLQALALMLMAATAGCASLSTVAQVQAAIGGRTIVLLGEVHDNAQQHERRAQALARWLATGVRPALLMEQFDRERQAEIDRARAQPGATAASIAKAAGGKGWSWALYEPYIELALRYGLPIVAANVSREDTRRIVREGLAAHGFDDAVPQDLLALQAQEIAESHCGMVDATLARSLALAQVARDQQMARLVQRYADRGVVLLAGNGHVRIDAGVPRWLTPSVRARTVAIGWIEEDRAHGMQFDVTLTGPEHPREDPCEAMRRR